MYSSYCSLYLLLYWNCEKRQFYLLPNLVVLVIDVTLLRFSKKNNKTPPAIAAVKLMVPINGRFIVLLDSVLCSGIISLVTIPLLIRLNLPIREGLKLLSLLFLPLLLLTVLKIQKHLLLLDL